MFRWRVWIVTCPLVIAAEAVICMNAVPAGHTELAILNVCVRNIGNVDLTKNDCHRCFLLFATEITVHPGSEIRFKVIGDVGNVINLLIGLI